MVDFAVPADSSVKIKNSEKIHKYLDFIKELKKKRVTDMHGSAQELRVCASAGHTFKDDTIEW